MLHGPCVRSLINQPEAARASLMHDGFGDFLRACSTIRAVQKTRSRPRSLCPQTYLAQYCELLGPQVLGAVVFYKTGHEVDPLHMLQLVRQAGLAEHEHLAQLPRHAN